MRCCSKQKATQSIECYSLTVVRAVDTMHATAVGFKKGPCGNFLKRHGMRLILKVIPSLTFSKKRLLSLCLVVTELLAIKCC